MNEQKVPENTEFAKEYLADFRVIRLADVPENVLEHYFRSDAGSMDPPEEDPLFVALSKNAFIRALEAGYEPVLLIIGNHINHTGLMEEVRSHCPELPVCLIPYGTEHLHKNERGENLYSFDNFGFSALFRKKPLPGLSDVLRSSKKVVVFRSFESTHDGLQELGHQIRSAVALGADAVLLQSGNTDPFNRRLIRITLGMLFLIPIAVYGSDEELFRALDENGFCRILLLSGKSEGAVTPDEAASGRDRIALITDHRVQQGQAPDPALSYDTGVYVPGGPLRGNSPCFTSVALYSLFSKDLT